MATRLNARYLRGIMSAQSPQGIYACGLFSLCRNTRVREKAVHRWLVDGVADILQAGIVAVAAIGDAQSMLAQGGHR